MHTAIWIFVNNKVKYKPYTNNRVEIHEWNPNESKMELVSVFTSEEEKFST